MCGVPTCRKRGRQDKLRQKGGSSFMTLAQGRPHLAGEAGHFVRSEEHTSELQSQSNLVCRLLLEKTKREHAFSPSAQYHQQAPILVSVAALFGPLLITHPLVTTTPKLRYPVQPPVAFVSSFDLVI